MKIKPVVLEKINTRHTNYLIDFEFETNITFIIGDSGTGKSAVFSFINEFSYEEKRLRCFNYIDYNKNYKQSIRKSKNKIFVIDNADILLDDGMRRYISKDVMNQYVIIGRNPRGLALSYDEIYEIESSESKDIICFRLKKALI